MSEAQYIPPFIVLEGDEGTGKSTVAKLVRSKLEAKGIPVTHTREPGGTALGEALRRELLRKRDVPLDPTTHILLHQAYRKEHVSNVILPALADGKVVVCERFYYSTLALNIMPYIAERPELQQLFMDTMPHVIDQRMPQPLTFILDLEDEAVRQERIAERNREKALTNDPELVDAYEQRTPEELALTTAAYKQFQGDPSIITLDSKFEPDVLADRIVEQIEAQIKLSREQIAAFDAQQQQQEEIQIAGVNTPAEPVEEAKPFDLVAEVEAFLDEHLVAALFNHDESKVAEYRPMARTYVLSVYEQAKDPVVFEGANRQRLRTNLHSILHFGHQLDLLRTKTTTQAA